MLTISNLSTLLPLPNCFQTHACFYLLAILLYGGLPAISNAQPETIAIYLRASHNGPVGEHATYYIKEEIRRSQGMKLAPSEDSAEMTMELKTLDFDESRTALGVAWYIPDFPAPSGKFFLESTVAHCGEEYCQRVAESIVVATDQQLLSVRRAIEAQRETEAYNE